MSVTPTPPADPRAIDPAPALLSRVRAELSGDFLASRPIRVSRAPGRLDVMGGIADYTGSLVCELPLDRAAAVAIQDRDDGQLQIFSFNLYDERKPFPFRIPLEGLVRHSAEVLRREFNEPGRKWAAYLAGCLFVLHEQGHFNLSNPVRRGMSLALYSTVPPGAGVASSAAIEVAAMMGLVDHFGIRETIEPLTLAAHCQAAENRIVGAPCGIMDQVTSLLGEPGALLRMKCQPHEILPPVRFPDGVRVIGINSNVKHDVGGPAYARTRCAAFMGHKLILEKMKEMGAAVGRQLIADPMGGYLANLDADDFKMFFRPHLPESLSGREFLDRYGSTIDPLTTVEPDFRYPVRNATDHHVLEARRVRRFVEFLEQARQQTGPRRKRALDSAGHLMYASHQSYTMDALLGADECDLLVQLARRREPAGIFGAKITGGGSGGTVAVLCDNTDRADAAIHDVAAEYERQTGRKAEIFAGTSPGAWHVGTMVT